MHKTERIGTVASVGVWLFKKSGVAMGGGGGGGGGLVSPLPGLCISIGHNYLQIGLVYRIGSTKVPQLQYSVIHSVKTSAQAEGKFFINFHYPSFW